MGNVGEIAQQELQGVFTRRQFKGRFRLSTAVMQVVFIIDDRKTEGWQFRIHQQVVMASVIVLNAGGRDTHVLQAEVDCDRA